MCKVTMNSEHNGIELYFDEKPSAAIRTQMKSEGFRWHGVKKMWYAKQTPSRLKLATKLSGEKVSATKSETTNATKTETAPVSKYGLKPGDILSAVWGYSMTIVEYYKVVAIPSPSKVELVELAHNVVKGSADSGGGMQVMPDAEKEMGKHIIKQIVKGRDEYGPAWYVKINDSCKLTPWDGEPHYQNLWD